MPLENQTSWNKKSPLIFLMRCSDITYYYPKRLTMIRAIYSRNPSNTGRFNVTKLKQNIVINCFVALQWYNPFLRQSDLVEDFKDLTTIEKSSSDSVSKLNYTSQSFNLWNFLKIIIDWVGGKYQVAPSLITHHVLFLCSFFEFS